MPGKSYQNCIIFSALCLFFLLVTGCGEQQDRKTNNVPAKTHTEKLKIGLITEQDIFSQKKRYEPLAAYLSGKIDATIELSILPRYGNIVDNFVSNGLDAAFFGSFTGALAIRKLGVQPLARPEHLDGTSTYYGMIFVRKDSAIHNAADMRGKRFAFVDKATTAGWLLPLHYFKDNGIEDFHTYFRETYFTGTHEDAIYDVLNGKADIGCAKNTVFYRLAEIDSRVKEQLQILATSPVVPANALAVRKDLDESLQIRLRNALLQMDQDVAGRKVLLDFGARRFIPTTVNDYAPVFEYANKIGLDLATYNYNNE
jgi:phosphonate transport system substrate-binding protein